MTNVYREFDPQTRQLVPINGSTSAGGVKNDANMLTIWFTVPSTFDTYKKALIAYDVKDDDKKTIYADIRTSSSVNGVTTYTYKAVVPLNVMKRVRKNKLSYQLVFINGDPGSDGVLAQSEIDTIVMSDQDTLFVSNSLIDDILADLVKSSTSSS